MLFYVPLCVYLQVATIDVLRWGCWRVRQARQGGMREQPDAVSGNDEKGECIR